VLAALEAVSKEIITVTNETYINAESVCQLLDAVSTNCNLSHFFPASIQPLNIIFSNKVDMLPESRMHGHTMAVFEQPPEKVKQDKIFENVGCF
jgi:hypothetical protein